MVRPMVRTSEGILSTQLSRPVTAVVTRPAAKAPSTMPAKPNFAAQRPPTTPLTMSAEPTVKSNTPQMLP